MIRKKVLRLLPLGLGLVSVASAQPPVLAPPQVVLPQTSPVCTGGRESRQLCITLPAGAISDTQDVLFLVDDTSSFSLTGAQGVALISGLQAAFPGVDFGFGVARFEDYGGPGADFGGLDLDGRPFILNQPIATAVTAGGNAALQTLIADALDRTAPGLGGDEPEASIAEGLYQAATGLGFDGDGDGKTTGTDGLQRAGELSTQTAPDASGDVPAFSTLAPGVLASGTVGGAGFRAAAAKLIIVVTDLCSITAFPGPLPLPSSVVGTGSTEQVSDLVCEGTPGLFRFGLVSDARSLAANSVPMAVVPKGAGTVPAAIAALNAAHIRVIGVSPGGTPRAPGSGPSFDPAHWLSAFARLTGAVAENGDALVFDAGLTAASLQAALASAVSAGATQPLDVALIPAGSLPAGLSARIAPPVVPDLGPGEQACFTAAFSGTGRPSGSFSFEYAHTGSGLSLALLPGEAQCVEPAQQRALLLSTSGTVKVKGGLIAENEDILRFDEVTRTYSMFFDGSDVGLLYENVDAFAQRDDGKLILSLSDRAFLSGVGWVDDEDILLFTPTRLGASTAGSFSLFFDGEARGIQGCQTDIDGVALSGGALFYSVDNTVTASGQTFKNEDIVRYDFGTGKHSLWFDGSDVGLSLANLDAFEIQDDQTILMSFDTTALVPGVGWVEDEDIVLFTPTSLGQNTAGTFTRYFNGDQRGILGLFTDIDALGRQVGGNPQ